MVKNKFVEFTMPTDKGDVPVIADVNKITSVMPHAETPNLTAINFSNSHIIVNESFSVVRRKIKPRFLWFF